MIIDQARPDAIRNSLRIGGINAAQLLDPLAVQLLETGEYRTRGNVADEYRKNFNAQPILVSIGLREEFGQHQPEAVTSYIRAFTEAVQLLRGSNDLRQDICREIGLKTPDGVKLFQQRSKPLYGRRGTTKPSRSKRRSA